MLQSLFGILYGPLAPMHEVVGLIAFGGAWPGRRQILLAGVTGSDSPVLDLGCGEGWLLLEARNRGLRAVGIDPSAAMVRRAVLRHSCAVRADAAHLPLGSGTVGIVIASYPGPWIATAATWREIERVVRPGGRIMILLGGTIERGRLAAARRLVGSLVYGRGSDPPDVAALPLLGGGEITGRWLTVPDEWGTALVWEGRRAGRSGA